MKPGIKRPPPSSVTSDEGHTVMKNKRLLLAPSAAQSTTAIAGLPAQPAPAAHGIAAIAAITGTATASCCRNTQHVRRLSEGGLRFTHHRYRVGPLVLYRDFQLLETRALTPRIIKVQVQL